MSVKSLFYVLLCSLGLCKALATENKPLIWPKMTYLTEDLPPYSYINQAGQADGFAIKILEKVWEDTQQQPGKITFMPWNRAYSRAQNEANSVLFSTLKTPQRLEQFNWACSIRDSSIKFFALKSNQFKIEGLNQTQQHRVAAIRNVASTKLLKSSGYRQDNLILINSAEQSIKMLSKGRVDMVLLLDHLFENTLEQLAESADKFESVYTLRNFEMCFAFNKQLPLQVSLEFQKALSQFKSQPEYQVLKRRYLN